MKKQDLRVGIIPRRLKNNDSNRNIKKEYDTVDLVYLDSYEEQFAGDITDIDRRASATDHAKIHNVYISEDYKTKKGDFSCWWRLRSVYHRYFTYNVYYYGDWFIK